MDFRETQTWGLLRDGLCLRRFEGDAGEAVVYDAFSGHTHLLDSTAARVFERLMQGPASMRQLKAAALVESADDLQSAEERLAEAVDRLARLDVIAPAAR